MLCTMHELHMRAGFGEKYTSSSYRTAVMLPGGSGTKVTNAHAASVPRTLHSLLTLLYHHASLQQQLGC